MARIFASVLVVFLVGRADAQNTLDAAATPLPRQPVRVELLLSDAQQLLAEKHFDQADKRYRKVFAIDPANAAAVRGLIAVQDAREHDTQEAAPAQPEEAPSSVQSPPVASADEQSTVEYPIDPNQSARDAMMRKAEKIIVPYFEVHDMPLDDVLTILRQDAWTYDKESSAGERGMNLSVVLSGKVVSKAGPIPGLPPPESSDQANEPGRLPDGRSKLSLTLHNIPLLALLKYVAQQVFLKVKVDPAAISLVQEGGSCESMPTVEFRISAPLLRTMVGHDDKDPSPRIDVKTYLESSGVPFPPGASVVYLEREHKLVVCNTQAAIDIIQSILAESEPVACRDRSAR